MHIQEILNEGINKLNKNNIEEASLKARILLANILDEKKEYLVAHYDKEVEIKSEEKFFDGINKLINNIPLQYITNKQTFMGLEFYVDENVLIPRYDTEILIEEVINISKSYKKIKMLDVCTGSGAIAVSLAKYIKNSNILATDISIKALDVARKNAEKNNVEVNFENRDLLNGLEAKFNIIVSNPPYIETEVIKTLDEQVKKEPLLALDGGKDGLDFYKEIINNAYKNLENDGYLCLEIGYNQKEKVIELLENSKKYKNIYSKKDLNENDRIVVAQKK